MRIEIAGLHRMRDALQIAGCANDRGREIGADAHGDHVALEMWSLNRFFRLRPSLLIGDVDFRLPWACANCSDEAITATRRRADLKSGKPARRPTLAVKFG